MFPYTLPVAHILCNRQVLRVVLDGLAEVTLRLIHVANVPVRPALPSPVAHLLCNLQVLRVVLDGAGYANLGIVYQSQGDLSKAIEHHAQHLARYWMALFFVLKKYSRHFRREKDKYVGKCN
jgi:hypothetical protein